MSAGKQFKDQDRVWIRSRRGYGRINSITHSGIIDQYDVHIEGTVFSFEFLEVDLELANDQHLQYSPENPFAVRCECGLFAVDRSRTYGHSSWCPMGGRRF